MRRKGSFGEYYIYAKPADEDIYRATQEDVDFLASAGLHYKVGDIINHNWVKQKQPIDLLIAVDGHYLTGENINSIQGIKVKVQRFFDPYKSHPVPDDWKEFTSDTLVSTTTFMYGDEEFEKAVYSITLPFDLLEPNYLYTIRYWVVRKDGQEFEGKNMHITLDEIATPYTGSGAFGGDIAIVEKPSKLCGWVYGSCEKK